MFHVKHYLGRPIKITLRRDSGILTGSSHCHSLFLETALESSIPSHNSTWPVSLSVNLAHWSKCVWSPIAREQMRSKKFCSVEKFSYLVRAISTWESFSASLTSLRKAHFFVFGSIKVTSKSSEMILSGSPGKPAPVPTSASRPRCVGSREDTKMLSPKWRPTISFSSSMDVRGIVRFHLLSNERYRAILRSCSSERGAWA